MKRMSRISKRMIVLALAAALLCPLLAVGSAAAEAKPANVWINGEPVTFSDAYPRNESGRVFLPFRAIFEDLEGKADIRTGGIAAAVLIPTHFEKIVNVEIFCFFQIRKHCFTLGAVQPHCLQLPRFLPPGHVAHLLPGEEELAAYRGA